MITLYTHPDNRGVIFCQAGNMKLYVASASSVSNDKCVCVLGTQTHSNNTNTCVPVSPSTYMTYCLSGRVLCVDQRLEDGRRVDKCVIVLDDSDSDGG